MLEMDYALKLQPNPYAPQNSLHKNSQIPPSSDPTSWEMLHANFFSVWISSASKGSFGAEEVSLLIGSLIELLNVNHENYKL